VTNDGRADFDLSYVKKVIGDPSSSTAYGTFNEIVCNY
jgi:hypothetical protein